MSGSQARAFEELLERCPHLKEWLDDRGLLPDEDARWLQKGEYSLSKDVAERLEAVHENEEMYDEKVEWFKCGAVVIYTWHKEGYWDMVVVFDINKQRIFAWEWEG